VLIKDARDFVKNTPTNEKETAGKTNTRSRGNQRQRQTNPPAATLFVGNLPFNAVKSDLERIFSIFGKLNKVRLMTFEDSGKCKGYVVRY
jgi:RNA recognition motif-containing protein